MSPTSIILILTIVVPTLCQRPFYAGLQPIGYPATASSQLSNRFGDDPLPPQLNGDKEYANRLDQLPVDKQPFWYLNREKYDEMMKNPQTYPQRPSVFNENSI